MAMIPGLLSRPGGEHTHFSSSEHVQTCQQNTQASQLQEQSVIAYPYFFEEAERRAWENNKLQELNKGESKCRKQGAYKKIILVKRVSQFSHQSDVLESWVINKQTLEVVRRYQGSPNAVDILDCLDQIEAAQPSQQTCNGVSNILFFGKCRFGNRSITIEGPNISQKHLLLQKVQHPCRGYERHAINFILCWQATRNSARRTRISSLLSSVSAELVKAIVSFIGHPLNIRPQYFLKDNCSKNGSLILLGPQVNMADYPNTEISLLRKGEGFCLKAVCTLSTGDPVSLTSRLNTFLSQNSLKQGTDIQNRQLELENEGGGKTLVMILSVASPSQKKLYVLYAKEAPYFLIKNQQKLGIANQKECIGYQNEAIGRLQCRFQGEWLLKVRNRQLGVLMGQNKKYEIKNVGLVRLGHSTKLLIQMDDNR